jgi:hypothetical protein
MTSRNILITLFALTLFGCASSGSSTGGESATRKMHYLECLQQKAEMADGYRPIARVVEVNTGSNEFKTTRICTKDGSVLITCSRPDNQMIVTKSRTKC